MLIIRKLKVVKCHGINFKNLILYITDYYGHGIKSEIFYFIQLERQNFTCDNVWVFGLKSLNYYHTEL
jgi:hypothetical protein